MFDKLRKLDNQIDRLSYICAGLNYEYEEMLDKITFNKNTTVFQSQKKLLAYGKGLKLSKKDFEKIFAYCKDYDYNFNIYLSSITFEEMEKELKTLKEKREQAELEFRKKLKKNEH